MAAAPGGPTIEGVVPVPGTVVVLSGEEYIDQVDGLVP
ncbi:hypothetical protein HNR10_001074 [Nocardiopsis aegyptia]|uniref:Uncharacterized protein n=1 Tax=Nocardiopsis aegyptia TaxID=220378 RepID=A0A7Z0EKW8_9ACTN|nr:hypothetical protein [Nocardiopsis aegyptia]